MAAFSDPKDAENTKRRVQNHVQDLIAQNWHPTSETDPSTSSASRSSYNTAWSIFDQFMSTTVTKQQGTPLSKAIKEVQKYVDDDILPRKDSSEPPAVAADADQNVPPPPRAAQPPTILADGALEQVLRHNVCASAKELAGLRNGTVWLTSRGEILRTLPRPAHFRSAAYPAADARQIAENIGAPADVDESRRESVDLSGHTSLEIVTPDTTTASDRPPEPAERSKIKYISARSVKTRMVSFQSSTPTTAPYSALCEQLSALTTTTDKAAVQPLLTSRSPLARDLPSMQMILAYMSGSNASHIETAAVVRGLCYAMAACPDMYDFDRTTKHFLRRETRQETLPP
ncbi:unnamed protein product [Parnassius apollo]|uniref:(apollo) hypothetical protein n=1 Tax=Parnassius apollo TaxID=110799 RepID=A0A8S3X9R4_PARAO|nr:unnamed protein product [Parnassius apollo]